MGLFDEIFIEDKVFEKFDIRCSCGYRPNDKFAFQTKDLGAYMDHYYLAYALDGEVRLFKLDHAKDKKFWHEYSDKEITEWNNRLDHDKKWTSFRRKKGDGFWASEAFYPENRKKHNMGELPHKWINIYERCRGCGNELIEYKVKFTDGVVKKVENITGQY